MIIVARNRVGEKTCAWNATAGEPYSCMDCGAKMHVTRKEGHDFFACFPGERHTTAQFCPEMPLLPVFTGKSRGLYLFSLKSRALI